MNKLEGTPFFSDMLKKTQFFINFFCGIAVNCIG